MNTPDYITELKPNEIFVFGSNLAGIHGAGAARIARLLFGAKYKVGVGFTGQCYAIPTKDHMIVTLPLEEIDKHVGKFLMIAWDFPDRIFLVTKIGCGLAGYKPRQIAPMFRHHPPNVILPKEFDL